MIKRVLLFLFALMITAKLTHQATDGFACVNIYAPPGDNSHWKRDEPLNRTLAQPFHYLNCGSQSYVFLSEDGETILKFFKFQHMRVPPILEFLPLTEKKQKKRAVLERTFDSIQIAYEKMKEETGLLYVHLAKTDHLKQNITIVDKIGKRHKINLDDVEFILQKKAVLAYEKINHWMTQGETEKAKNGIQKLMQLSVDRCKKGVFDKDPDFETNFGFVNDIPIQIDFGRLSLNKDEKSPSVFEPEMIRITRAFEKWIALNHPTLLDSFQSEIHYEKNR